MTSPLFEYSLPFTSAGLYALASLFMKRALNDRAGTMRVLFVSNWIIFGVFALMAFTGQGQFQLSLLPWPLLSGTFFFMGQVFTFLAINRGDVSVVTPVMGGKPLFVGLIVVIFLGESIPSSWWIAGVLTVIALIFFSYNPSGIVRTNTSSIVYALLSAACFAACDALIQRWSPLMGISWYFPLMMGTLALLSIGIIPFFRQPLSQIPTKAWKWLLPGCVLLGLQALILAYAMSEYGNATAMNIIYSSRGLWSIALVWLLGSYFGNDERRRAGPAIMISRTAGAILLSLAVILVLLGTA